MPNIDKEARVVTYLLQRYNLWDTRCRYMIRDLNRDLDWRQSDLLGEHTPSSGRLTLAAFDEFFSCAYPVRLVMTSFRGKGAGALSAQDLFLDLEEAGLVREFQAMRLDEEDGRPCALACPWPYGRNMGHTLVLHNYRQVDVTFPGTHLILRLNDGPVVVLQTLETLLTVVDMKAPPENWKKCARSHNYDSPVAPHHPVPERQK